MRELPAGSDATLLDLHAEPFPEATAVRVARALRAAVDDGRLPMCDVVVGADTVLVEALPGAGLDRLSILRIARDARAHAPGTDPATDSAASPLTVPTVYDGADLASAADLAGVSTDRLIRAHSRVVWTVQFMGFAPGFGYLVPHPDADADDTAILARITRRAQSRPSVPAGSVAIAAGYSAVYPRTSPGGWFLLGHTDIPLWNSAANPPAALHAGRQVRFVPARADDAHHARRPALTPAPEASRTHAGLIVVSTGPLATLQDLGRPGLAHLGVPRSGAADQFALTQANRLVGNAEHAAAVEVTLGGWSARAVGRQLVAVTGPAVDVRVDGVPVGSHCALTLPDGAVIAVATPPRGCRNYVAIRGGFDAAPELGSRAGDVLSALGPPPLRPGDALPVDDAAQAWPAVDFAPTAGADGVVELFADRGPRDDRLEDAAVLTAGRWTVAPASNRVGVRLVRTGSEPYPEHRADLGEMRSEGVPLGGIQIPPNGHPVIFLTDHPVTGGYPVAAVLTPESRWRAAQLVAGDVVRLTFR
ncbi:carboxyltransferase domain-containing protein [Gordonia aichiensis]|uniref:5-oxoprolinase subunit B/C family protein n=1 Tax=Gordonia aichiensis TaxID=36820 RepID=UPI0032631FAB